MKKIFSKLSIVLAIVPRMPFYAVARGRNTGVFLTWPECQMQVTGFRNPLFRKFPSFGQAEHFVMDNGGTVPANDYTLDSSEEDYDSNDDDCSPSNTNEAAKKKEINVKEVVYSDSTQPADRINALQKYIAELSSTNLEDLTSAGGTKRTASTDGDGPSCSAKSKKPNETSPTKGQMKKYGKYSFLEDANGYVQVYTDGSCENNGRANAVAGLGVYFAEGHALNTAQPVSGRATNNCGEIQASTLAVKLAIQHSITKLCINTDSKFLINSMTQWINGWKARGWRLKDGKPVKNEIDFKQLDNVIKSTKMDVKWNYVKAHCGILGNERADKLAREGGEMYKRQHN